MTEAATIATSKIQLIQPFPNFDFADPFVFSTQVIATVLACVAMLYFYKFYRLSKFIYLFGIVVGFSFYAFGQALLAADVWLEFNPQIFNTIYWMRLLALSYGFSFLAVSYYYKSREEDKIPQVMRIATLSGIAIIIMIALVWILPPTPFAFPSYTETDEYFAAFNMAMLAYVLKSSIDSIIQKGRKELMYIPSAYVFLLLGQYSAFIYAMDGDATSFIGQGIAKIIGLALFVVWWYRIMRPKKVAEMGAERLQT